MLLSRQSLLSPWVAKGVRRVDAVCICRALLAEQPWVRAETKCAQAAAMLCWHSS